MDKIIEVSDIQKVEKGNVLCRCDVYIRPWGMTLKSVTVIQKGENRWINMPSRKWEKDGEEKWEELVIFDDSVKKRLRTQVMRAIDEFLLGNPEMKPVDLINENDDIPF